MALTLRTIKGSAITGAENDANFTDAVTQASHGLAVGDLVKVKSAGGYEKSQADAEANLAVGCVVGVNGNDFYVKTDPGPVTKGTHGFGSRGTVVYESQGSAGVFTATAPSSGIVRKLGIVLDADTILFTPGAYKVI